LWISDADGVVDLSSAIRGPLRKRSPPGMQNNETNLNPGPSADWLPVLPGYEDLNDAAMDAASKSPIQHRRHNRVTLL
jgi:hypothetical protein